MAVTNVRGRQILDGTIQREDLDITTAGKAVVAKVIAGTGINISSTGVDAGTGDVTINLNTPVTQANGGTGASGQQAGLNALTNVSGAANEQVLTKDTATGNAIFKAPAVSSVFGRTGAVVAQSNDYTWAQINKSVSSIADIATRSHTLLTDVGTNTHAQIDSHIANTSNPHNVTKAQVGLGNVTDDAQLKRAANDFTTFTGKTTPVGADVILIEDSAASFAKRSVTLTNLGAQALFNAIQIRGRNVTTNAPSIDDILRWDGTNIVWTPHHPAYQTYTPTIGNVNGSIANVVVNYARYRVFGKTVHLMMQITLDMNGGPDQITFTLPSGLSPAGGRVYFGCGSHFDGNALFRRPVSVEVSAADNGVIFSDANTDFNNGTARRLGVHVMWEIA